jgi:adenosylmethionine-8-amino-7-oxononanoate aminotransferase
VSGIGHLSTRVEQVMIKTMKRGISYVTSMMFDTDVTENLARFLVTSTDGKMSKAVFYCSGKSHGRGQITSTNKFTRIRSQ